MRIRTPFLAAALLLSLGACSASRPDVPTGWQQESVQNFSVYRPGGWTVEEPQEGMLQFRPPASTDVDITIAVQSTPEEDMTLAAYNDEYLASLGPGLKEEGLSFTIIASKEATLAGSPGHSLLLSLQGEHDVKALSVWTVQNGKVYTVTYAATPEQFDVSMPVMETMLKSAILSPLPAGGD
ncbi:hypothetical protein HZA45_03645 [Candidatus Peregrinibacteria bacterium]|nr:hypothetical protein [Candidatus Peregrinibacteria bacterium]